MGLYSKIKCRKITKKIKKQIIILLLLVITVSCSDAKKSKLKDGTKKEQAQNDTFLKATIDDVAFMQRTRTIFQLKILLH